MADFEPFEAKMLAEGMPELAIRTFRHYYRELASGSEGTVSRREIGPVGDVPSTGELRAAKAGAAALDQTVVLKLNGGLGTSMGMTQAKSLLTVKDGHNFLDVIALQVQWLCETHQASVPLLLMNSFRTREDSLAVLARHANLASSIPADFLQHKVPKILAGNLSPASWPSEPDHEWCPPGHGDLYTALVTSGALDALLDAGIHTAFVSNADNLGAVLDLDLLGWFVESGAPFAMEVKERTVADRKGGHLALQSGGGLTLREIAQCPEDERAEFENIELYRYFNTNNLWLDLRALKEVLREREGVLGLPMIQNQKSLDPKDGDSPQVFQLETAMGAALSIFEGARAIRVPSHRFAPVKTTADLLSVWSDAYTLAPDFRILPAEGARPEETRIELDPQFFRHVDLLQAQLTGGVPSLRDCTSLEVKGDVRFGKGVVLRGDVRVEAAPGDIREIEDGAILGS